MIGLENSPLDMLDVTPSEVDSGSRFVPVNKLG